jgi:hypothetical protein
MHKLVPSICALAALSLAACGGGRHTDEDSVAGPAS